MLSRLRMLVLGSVVGGALLLMPDTADAQYYWGGGYGWRPYYGGYYSGYYPRHYSRYYYSYPSYGYSYGYSSPYYGYSYPYYGGRHWGGYRGYYRPRYGYSRFGGYGFGYPRFSVQIGPFGYTRW